MDIVQRFAATRETHTLTEFKKAMAGIYSTCVSKKTLDEAPFAYRAQEDLIKTLSETVDVLDVIKPVYNFKAGSK